MTAKQTQVQNIRHTGRLTRTVQSTQFTKTGIYLISKESSSQDSEHLHIHFTWKLVDGKELPQMKDFATVPKEYKMNYMYFPYAP